MYSESGADASTGSAGSGAVPGSNAQPPNAAATAIPHKSLTSILLFPIDRQLDAKVAAFAFLDDLDFATMRQYIFLGDGQTEAAALDRAAPRPRAVLLGSYRDGLGLSGEGLQRAAAGVSNRMVLSAGPLSQAFSAISRSNWPADQPA